MNAFKRTAMACALGLASLIVATGTAQAAPRACWSSNGYFEHDIKTGPLVNVSYDAEFHWCATNGVVDGFVVDKTYAVAKQGARNAKIDIQPYRPGEWGPVYHVYLDVTADRTVTGGNVSVGGVSLSGAPTNYHDRWEIDLGGNGSMTGEQNTAR